MMAKMKKRETILPCLSSAFSISRFLLLPQLSKWQNQERCNMEGGQQSPSMRKEHSSPKDSDAPVTRFSVLHICAALFSSRAISNEQPRHTCQGRGDTYQCPKSVWIKILPNVDLLLTPAHLYLSLFNPPSCWFLLCFMLQRHYYLAALTITFQGSVFWESITVTSFPCSIVLPPSSFPPLSLPLYPPQSPHSFLLPSLCLFLFA